MSREHVRAPLKVTAFCAKANHVYKCIYVNKDCVEKKSDIRSRRPVAREYLFIDGATKSLNSSAVKT